MKKIGTLFLLALLLCGCGREGSEEPVPDTSFTRPAVSETAGLSLSPGPLEAASEGAVTVTPLYLPDCTGLMPMGDHLLVLSTGFSGTRLTKLSREDLTPAAERELNIHLLPEDPSLQVYPERIAYFDRQTRQTVVLDARLREAYRIDAPEELSGIPLLSRDGNSLYYCTDAALRCLDLDLGISRVLRELECRAPSLEGLLFGETVLRLSGTDEAWGHQQLFVCARTGQTLGLSSGALRLHAGADAYFASYPNGSIRSLIFGSLGQKPRELTVDSGKTECFFLGDPRAVVAASRDPEGQALGLDYYDLDTGRRLAGITLPTEYDPWYMVPGGDGSVCFTIYDSYYHCQTLCRWYPDRSVLEDPNCYTGPHYTPENPDLEGLLECEALARELGERYGIRIAIWKDAVEAEPWDFGLEPEFLTGVIRRELEALGQRLERYPPGFLQTLAQCSDGLTICLVRSITATPDSRNVASADGLQFWQDNHAYIALTMGRGSEKALYHELCHLIDTQVFSESNAYDEWDRLNPRDFEYDYDYLTNLERTSQEYLQDHCRSFIDMYSMSFPKEDRARIMEYAMTEGNEHLFRSPMLQAKLALLCIGIREAFQLENCEDPLPWEQYLQNPLEPDS